MITRDFSVISIDVTGVSLSLSLSLPLYYSQKSLTHNIGSASALPVISFTQNPLKTSGSSHFSFNSQTIPKIDILKPRSSVIFVNHVMYMYSQVFSITPSPFIRIEKPRVISH